jgi:ribosomal-protein-alanine N-acetyltransferase
MRTRTGAVPARVDWATTHIRDRPLIARVRPDNAASLRVAARTGLRRVEHPDSPGEDGPDWIFTSDWPEIPECLVDS